jgi:hypothetical protein
MFEKAPESHRRLFQMRNKLLFVAQQQQDENQEDRESGLGAPATA